MSYLQPGLAGTSSPFAQLRITTGTGIAQWSTQSQSWVSIYNVAAGNCIMWGLVAVVANSSNSGIGSLRFSSTSDRYLYAQYEQGTVTASRSNSGEVMISYGTDATWSTANNTGSSPSIDYSRNRCMLMRLEA